MKYKIEIRNDQDEDMIICAKQSSELLERIENLIKESECTVFGYKGARAVKLDTDNVFCFFIEGGRIYAHTECEKLLVKDRLYRIEEIFSESFIKINQSCLVNIAKIARFDSSIGGALLVVLKNGYKDYVSRRQLKHVKERMKI